jgi:hypothetical protein
VWSTYSFLIANRILDAHIIFLGGRNNGNGRPI